MAWDYNEKVKGLYRNPVNVGEIADADGVGEVGSIVCGDALKLSLKIDRERDTITDAKFQTFGCGSAIASSSALTEMIIGKTVDEAMKITNKDIVTYLGGLPAEKMHCSVMGQEALEAAVADYRGLKVIHEEEDPDTRMVCHCFGVSNKKIEKAILENNLHTVEDVTNYTKAGGGCGSCIDEIEGILDEVKQRRAAAPPAPPPDKPAKLTTLQKIKLIEETIEKEIRPNLIKDGGDMELLDVEGNNVVIEFKGRCMGCQASTYTLQGVQEKLREMVSPDLIVTVGTD
ncbi:MAG: Fe-S cluster assembly protein NifU [bacterium]